MFCMNCGQQLPDGAKYCLQCGTPQGAVSPTGTTQAETINLDGMHTFVPALCPNCGAHMKVDSSAKVAHCNSCGTECLVQDAIKALTVRGNVQVGSATINVSSTNTDSLLQRVEIMLGDGDFGGAMSKCDTILDSDPTNGKVYFYMLMSSLNCRSRNALATQKTPFNCNQYYLKAMQYGDPELRNELQEYINVINARNEAIRKEEEEERKKGEEKRRKWKEEREEERKKEEEKINAKYDANLKNPTVGAEIRFGHYSNGRSVIWKILRIQNNMLFIISSDIICKLPYHQPGGRRTWADCTLRKWLNNEFIQGYFAPAEQARILPCKLNNDNNPQYNTRGGVPTTDKVFLLSINEANQLFANNQAREIGSWWWLRSPGCNPDLAAIVNIDGKVNTYGTGVSIYDGVRPALWLNLNS